MPEPDGVYLNQTVMVVVANELSLTTTHLHASPGHVDTPARPSQVAMTSVCLSHTCVTGQVASGWPEEKLTTTCGHLTATGTTGDR